MTADLQAQWLEVEHALTVALDPRERPALFARQGEIEHRWLAQVLPASPAPAKPKPRARNRSFRIVIVGAGIGGLCMGARLREAGFNDVAILEKSGDLGGTWHHNRYPGVACDIASHLYTLPFFPNPDWSQKNAPGGEIKAYLERLAVEYGLRERIRFNQTVNSCVYRNGRWDITTDTGSQFEADVLIAAAGLLHIPRLPDIEAMESFAGRAFHSSQWPADLTLHGQRLGIIGTGSSGVQIASSIIGSVKQLSLFQRTAQWILPVSNDLYSTQRRELLRRHPELTSRIFEIQLSAFNQTVGRAVGGDGSIQQLFEGACRSYLQTVRDSSLRAKLTPPAGTRALCKRLVMSATFYDTVQQPNCELVTESIAAIAPAGVCTADGRLHGLDVLVFASGFESHAYCRHLNISVAGGPSLEDAWSGGARAHDSVAVAGFPNLFIVGGPYSPVGNLSTMICSQLEADYIIRLLDELEARRGHALAPSRHAEDAFVAQMQQAAAVTTWASGCNSWYLDGQGRLDMWTRSPEAYIEHLNSGPRMDEYEILMDRPQ